MNRRKYILVFGAVVTVLMMMSSVTAVQYVNENETLETLESIEVPNLQNRLSEVRNSEKFLQLEKIANQYFPHEYDDYVESQIASMGLPEEVFGDPDAYVIIFIIVQLTLLLLGHNLVGETAALVITLIGAIGPALLYGTMLGALFEMAAFEGVLIWLDSLRELSLFNYGLMGLVILYLSVFTVGAVLAVCCIPLAWVAGFMLVYLDCVLCMLEYMAAVDPPYQVLTPITISTITPETITEAITTFTSTASAPSQSTT